MIETGKSYLVYVMGPWGTLGPGDNIERHLFKM